MSKDISISWAVFLCCYSKCWIYLRDNNIFIDKHIWGIFFGVILDWLGFLLLTSEQNTKHTNIYQSILFFIVILRIITYIEFRLLYIRYVNGPPSHKNENFFRFAWKWLAESTFHTYRYAFFFVNEPRPFRIFFHMLNYWVELKESDWNVISIFVILLIILLL